MNVIVMYKDYRYDMMEYKSNKFRKLKMRDVYMILVPWVGDPSVYIPMKPSEVLFFDHATVEIIHQSIVEFDVEHFTQSPKLYTYECNDLIEFANAIHNLFEFRGICLEINDSMDKDLLPCTDWGIIPRRIKVSFYDKKNSLINQIDTGLTPEPYSKNSKYNANAPIAYWGDKLLFAINHITFTPDEDDLPYFIYLDDMTSYKPRNTLKDRDNPMAVFYNIPGMWSYVLCTADTYRALNDTKLKVLIVHHYYANESQMFLSNYMDYRTLCAEKESFINGYIKGLFFSDFVINAYIENAGSFYLWQKYFQMFIVFLQYFNMVRFEEDGLEGPHEYGMEYVVCIKPQRDTTDTISEKAILSMYEINKKNVDELFNNAILNS